MSRKLADIHEEASGTNLVGKYAAGNESITLGHAKPAENGYANGDIEFEEIDKGTTNAAPPRVGMFQLFRFADGKDRLLIIFGTLAAMIVGCAFPVNMVLYGQVLDKFIDFELEQAAGIVSDESIGEVISGLVIYFVLIGITVFVMGYVAIAFWSWSAERQTHRIRKLAFHSIMTQHIGWFDVHPIGELNTRLTDDIAKINAGIGEKYATFLQWTTTFFAGYGLGFAEGWELTLVILSVAPLLVVAVVFVARMNQKFIVVEQAAYARAGAVAEEVLSAIRTVAAFGGEKKESARYNGNLFGAQKAGEKRGLMSGLGIGTMWLLIFSIFALAFWYGNQLVTQQERYSGGTIVMVFMGVLFGTMSLGNAAPNLEFIAGARGAAASIYELIDSPSEIDSSSSSGNRPSNFRGDVNFENVHFHYPARPDIKILQGLTLSVKVGQTVALVGPSGCGKSTTIQLLQRFYDPLQGTVRIDGTDTRELNVKWLRQHIGVVSQEPILFATTIAENIRYGRDGVKMDDIAQAAREANAHDFISRLPEGYETMVGERGAQLSGGQKQRIAIARALVRNPKILLLDEATSALDTESEATVQAALDKARQGRTTLVIAHRLSTIQNADVIVGIDDGQVEEMGTHDELMKKEGIYHMLVTNQTRMFESQKSGLPEYDDLDAYNVDDLATSVRSRGASYSRGISMSRSVSRKYSRGFSTNSMTMDPADPRYGRKVSTRSRAHSRQRAMSTSSMASVKSVERMESGVYEDWSNKDEEQAAEMLPQPTLKRIISINSPEWPYIAIGCFAAIFTGAAFPCFSIVFSEILGNFAEPEEDVRNQNAIYFSLALFGIGVIVGIANTCQQSFFAKSGEALTIRLRQMAFAAMLRQDIGWYDDRANQVGALTARLASDASLVRGAAGQQMGVFIQAMMNIGSAIIIAFVFGWKLACVVVAFLPLLVGAGMVQARMVHGAAKGDKKALEEGGKIAVETIDNIRTVASLTKEEDFEDRYNDHFKDMYKKNVVRSHTHGLFYGLGQSVIFFSYAAAFSYGGDLVDAGEMEFKNVFRVFSAITFGGQALGRASTLAPDLSKAKLAAAKIFSLLDRTPPIDSSNTQGEELKYCKGDISLNNVHFRYPSRPEYKVLQGLTVSVKTGQTLALVGGSGCGKSTSIQLLERFYDPEGGSVRLDNMDTKRLNIQWLRSRLGLVSQEPILFDASIKDNIAYGDNSREVSMQEVIEAARGANIHNFIELLPQGYDTNVGDKGTQLSGGQKQRIAIARALVRKPKVLLLDEATSALDTESEKVVQEALDKARVGRTSIVIAHRLSTIQNSDIIAVIHNGQVVEQGTHKQLLAKEGFYYRLQQAQNRRKDE